MADVSARLVDEITDRVLARLQVGPDSEKTGESILRQLVDHGACRVGCRARATHLPAELAATIDHTLLKPDATLTAVRQLCAEAREYGFASVCVNPTWVDACARDLAGRDVEVCTVVGFPLGATTTGAKVEEARIAVADGATELDMVINVGALKSGMLELVRDDVRAVVRAAGDACVKVILETVLLTDEEKVEACALAQDADAHYVKTSTGFAGGGATVEDIALMRRVVRGSMGVKASGGVRDRAGAQAMIAAGANRIGASAGVKIVRGEKASGGY